MTTDHSTSTHPARALSTTIMLWGGLLSGQVTFVIVILVLKSGNRSNPSSDLAELLHVISWIALAAAVPMGYFIRNQTYKANWQGDVVTPGGYVTGNLLLLAMLEGAGMIALVGTLLADTIWPNLLPAILAMVAQAINFPNGKAMRPTTNPYAGPTSTTDER